MNKQIAKIFLVFIIICNFFFLGGCWDARELDKLFIVTGLSIDDKENDELELSIQIGKTKEAGMSSSGSVSGDTTVPLVLSAQNKSIVDAYMTLNENCSRGLLIDHAQVLLIGQSVAEKGIKRILDVFIRVQEARIEMPVVIVEGVAKEILTTSIDESSMSANFVAQLFDGLGMVSKYYKTRVIDLMHRLVCKEHAATLPIVKIVQKNDKDVIEFDGFAILKDGMMVGKMTKDETRGYVLGNGNVTNLILHAEDQDGLAAYRLQSTKSKISVELDSNNQVKVNINVKGNVELDELSGFEDFELNELLEHLKSVVQYKIKYNIEKSLEKTKLLQTDIYGMGEKIFKKYPNQWKTMKENWDNIYNQAEFVINVKINIPVTGDILQSIEIEQKLQEKENN